MKVNTEAALRMRLNDIRLLCDNIEGAIAGTDLDLEDWPTPLNSELLYLARKAAYNPTVIQKKCIQFARQIGQASIEIITYFADDYV